jgi:Zn-dependent M28 family amino/carboxypeptidase
MNTWRLASVVISVGLLAGCARGPASQTGAAAPTVTAPAAAPKVSPVPPAAEVAAAVVTADFLSAGIKELSDDRYGGRGPATAGDNLARKWIAAQMQSLGLEPGGTNNSYEQPFDIIGLNARLPATWRFTAGNAALDLKLRDDYVATAGMQKPHGSFRDAEVVFVGYGIQAPEYQWDDFKGMDLKGKVLLMLNNDPDWDDALFAGKTRLYYGRWEYKYESAARQGAAAAIIIHTTPSAGYPFQVLQSSNSGEQFELPAGREPRLQLNAFVTEDKARQLAQLGGQDLAKLVAAARSRDFRPVPLGVKTSISFTTTISKKATANVAGLLRGTDPKLAKQVVIYSAHHDHLGIGEPDARGDRIYNGALDNASGVVQILAVAKAFHALKERPRRSVLFLAVAGEEQGLLGSRYYAAHPTFAPGRIAANFNVDEGNVYGRAIDIQFIGKGKSTLDAVIGKYAAYQDRVVEPDQLPDRGYYYRSDQFAFAKIGVPAFYSEKALQFRGRPPGWGKERVEEFEATRYHQPSDEWDPSWTYEGMIEDVQLLFWSGLDIANADQLPAWTPGDEFEAARKAALAALKDD